MYFGEFDFRPKFIPHKDDGEYPYDLLFGFEAELGLWLNHYSKSIVENIDDLIRNTNNFYYIKYDGSIKGCAQGAEINSHPFNWNWLLNNQHVIAQLCNLSHVKGDGSEYYGHSTAYLFKVNRSCGFHIHISRKFFKKDHIYRIAKFFYENHEFIKNISLRGNTYYFKQYAGLNIGESVEKILLGSTFNKGVYRYSALNLTPKYTIEIRIFNGTLNAQTIFAYLEFALAITLFSKNFNNSDMNEKCFLKYVKENISIYNHFVDLYDKKITWK